MFELLFFILAILIGAVASWQAFSWFYARKLKKDQKNITVTEANVLLERIEKVFKVVLAEGYFSEIYDHSTKKDFWGFFQSNNKALVVAKAKVAVGYDFSKMKFSRDETTRTIKIEAFAPPEILSIDTDYKFYDINQGILSKFNNDDYTSILSSAKKLMHEKALESDLPQIAQNQVKVMMKQLAGAMNWELQIPESTEISPKLLPK